jgi:hypothetical protein
MLVFVLLNAGRINVREFVQPKGKWPLPAMHWTLYIATLTIKIEKPSQNVVFDDLALHLPADQQRLGPIYFLFPFLYKFVLEQGKIVEKGTHEQLVDDKGLYYAMWRQ